MPVACPSWFRAAPLVALMLSSQPAAADQTDQRLTILFAQLRLAASHEDAVPVESLIWDIWDESNDSEIDTLMQTGAAALAAQDGAGALAAYSQVVQRAPRFAEGWNKRATTLYLLGRFVEAEADIAHVLALEPRHFGALSGLGLCETQRGHLPEAVAAFERALAVDPTMDGVRANIRHLRAEIARRSI